MMDAEEAGSLFGRDGRDQDGILPTVQHDVAILTYPPRGTLFLAFIG